MSYYPNRATSSRRRGCSPLAMLGLIALLALVGAIALLAWPHQRQQAGSSGGAPVALTRLATIRTATRALSPQPAATRTAERAVNSTATATALPTPAEPDWAALQRLMLAAINEARVTAQLSPVAWDQLAADVGAAHAHEMVTQGYFSHWNLAGLGPDLRYGLAGGAETVNENLHLYWLRYDDGRGAPIADWEEVVLAGQAGLMESEGHRANILDPAHTHVGIGMAYDAPSGTLAIAQEFINRYAVLDSPPRAISRGERYVVKGSIAGGVSDPVVNIRYLPHPDRLTAAQVEQKPSVYQSESIFFDYGAADLGEGLDLTFDLPGDAPPGIYLVCLWIDIGWLPGEAPQVITLVLPLSE